MVVPVKGSFNPKGFVSHGSRTADLEDVDMEEGGGGVTEL